MLRGTPRSAVQRPVSCCQLKHPMSESDNVFITEQVADILVVTPTGPEIGFQLSKLDKQAREIAEGIDGEQVRHVVFDADHGEFISSSVIGAMIQMWEAAKNNGGRFVICNFSDDALAALVAMRLDTKWPRYESRDDAVQALNQA